MQLNAQEPICLDLTHPVEGAREAFDGRDDS